MDVTFAVSWQAGRSTFHPGGVVEVRCDVARGCSSAVALGQLASRSVKAILDEEFTGFATLEQVVHELADQPGLLLEVGSLAWALGGHFHAQTKASAGGGCEGIVGRRVGRFLILSFAGSTVQAD